MSILLDPTTTVIVQGITGKEGLKAAIAMRDYGTRVAAGVTPGKGGTSVEGFPVYNTVAEALHRHPNVTCSVLYVPASVVFDACLEALEAGVTLLNIITEHVPVADAARLWAIAQYRRARIIGPSSIGVIAPGIGKIGSIGGFTPSRSFSPGPVGVVSKSGGMCSEIAHMLTQQHIGQNTVIGIGGDRIAGSSFGDLLALFEQDTETKLVVLYGEIGGTYEEQAAAALRNKTFTKPLVACVSGLFAETLPHGLHLGHAGAIIEGAEGTRDAKVRALRAAGAQVVDTVDDIAAACASLLSSSAA